MKNNICTSIEQSKKLIELGIDVNTADMYWGLNNQNHPHVIGKYCAEYGGMQLPAWSLSALLELIPESIDDNTDNFSQLEMTKKSISYAFSDGMLRIGFLKEYLIDAAYEMVCWLKKEEYI